MHMAGTFRFAAQNGRQNTREKKFVQPSLVKLLVGFQPNFTGLISTIS
jgi:hypothetical protein